MRRPSAAGSAGHGDRAVGMAELLFQPDRGLVGEGVLHGLGVAVDVVARQLQPAGEVELPEAVLAHHALGLPLAGGGEAQGVNCGDCSTSPAVSSGRALRASSRAVCPRTPMSSGQERYSRQFSVALALEPEILEQVLAPDPARPPAAPAACAHRRPRWGAKRSETISTPLDTTTITGPVGSRGTRALASEPVTPAAAPMPAASRIMEPRRSVHWRAAAAGVMRAATMSTTPTVCRPTTTTTTRSRVRRTSSLLHRKPQAGPEGAVEGEELQLLVEEEEGHHHDPAQDGHHLEVLLHQCGGLAEEVLVEAALIAVRQLLDVGEQHDARLRRRRRG